MVASNFGNFEALSRPVIATYLFDSSLPPCVREEILLDGSWQPPGVLTDTVTSQRKETQNSMSLYALCWEKT